MAVKLIAGFTHVQRGRAAYRGVLRVTQKSAPAWTCRCPQPHLTAEAARSCADAELYAREQGGREVISLRRCEPCDRWWPDGPASACPVCSVPMERVKLVVLERTRVLDQGNRKH
jgi:hypothetical protein